LTEAPMPVLCQVRSKTESPCPHLAVVEIRGIAFCGACAREQETYFAIGELTQEETQGLRSKQLTEALEKMRRVRASSKCGIPAEIPHGFPGVNEAERLVLTKS
jgi:predicted Fe-S protein YdhL (DUF1289 family)